MAAVPLDADSSEEYGVGMELECDEKFYWHVAGVRPGGPAAAAGITRGDVLRAVDWTLVKVNRPVICFRTAAQHRSEKAWNS
jgi:S1-C subfamily serine protease